MAPSELYLWQPAVCPHTQPLFEAFHRLNPDTKIYIISQQDIPEDRRALGWSVHSAPFVINIVAPSREEVIRLIGQSSSDSIHIFHGLRRVPCIVNGLRAAIKLKRRFGILSEPRVFEGLFGFARLLQTWITEANLRFHADFILAIGRHGPTWFRLAGYTPSQIFPFAYFLMPGAMAAPRVLGARKARVALFGRLIPAKGIHVFLDAIPLITEAAEFRVGGTGAWAEKVQQTLLRLGGRGTYLGVIPIERMPEALESIDILVLPSTTKDDGWGAIVSEALFQGSAIVVSDRVGASVCISDGARGRVVAAGDPAALANAVNEIIANGELSPSYQEARSEWARSHLDSESGARYLQAIFRCVYGGANRPSDLLQD